MKVILKIPEKVNGMNGSKGLLRASKYARRSKKEAYAWLFKAQTTTRFEGAVTVKITRTCRGREMDPDNIVSTAKVPLDALVLAGIIKDDSNKIIKKLEFTQRQIGKNEPHCYQIEIESFNN